ncbi:oligosaccharide flippase family protein [Bradyrhizobium daqingense]|uniref:O-antigen/teichoic acid export membrane protein n=1 Tax=Bradyrhizobium daqingense TaxID=993502 RepID=A0A562LQN5_9BRAD|nr:oligosaccharide flippase family protein [Bradyrhizobium daqingense]TWI09888.1 O-antigen/teichoic acid export membrane protein [Bradyrhizobium daqingense]UFS88204.1 oligosaccharide flippase family protein [Bradyrhizobium daqingense]
MLKRLVQNTVVSAIVFGLVAILGVVVIPVIIGTWGVAAFGLIVLTRLFLPSGLIGVIDFGLPEVTTQVVARAREHRDWGLGGSQIVLLAVISLLLGILVSLVMWWTAPLIVTLFKVEPAHAASFTNMLLATAASNLVLFPALIWEGIVKGFERYGLLRLCEFLTTLLYVGATIHAARSGQPYEVVTYYFLASGLLRALILLGASIAALSRTRIKLSVPVAGVSREVMTRCILVMQGKLIGGIIAPIQPFLIGAYIGPQSVGIYDTLVRIPRLAKVVASLLISAMLPVVSRLDQRNSHRQFNRFGETGVMMLPIVTVPPFVAAAVMSPAIMHLWIGPQIAPYAHWMGLMFVVTMCYQYVIFGNTLFMTRTKVQRRLNRLMMIHLLIWAVVTAAGAHLLAERAFILGQILGTAAIVPWQLLIFVRELEIDSRRFWFAILSHWAILAIAALPLAAILHFTPEPGILSLAGLMAVYCAATWIAQYFLVLSEEQRGLIGTLGRTYFGRKGISPAAL